jgi:hypothetical protein
MVRRRARHPRTHGSMAISVVAVSNSWNMRVKKTAKVSWKDNGKVCREVGFFILEDQLSAICNLKSHSDSR